MSHLCGISEIFLAFDVLDKIAYVAVLLEGQARVLTPSLQDPWPVAVRSKIASWQRSLDGVLKFTPEGSGQTRSASPRLTSQQTLEADSAPVNPTAPSGTQMAQSASDIFPKQNFFGSDPGERSPSGRRLNPDASILQEMERRHREKEGLPPAVTPQRPPQPSLIDIVWMRRVNTAVANSSFPRTDEEKACLQIAKQVLTCRISPEPPIGVDAVDVACVGRNLDNRNWQGEMAQMRGGTYVHGFRQGLCYVWIGINQVEPLRR